MDQQRFWKWLSAGTAALTAVGLLVTYSAAHAGSRAARPSVTGLLSATAADPNADGNFEENVEDGMPDGSGGMQGELIVRAHNLAPRTTFRVNVGGVRVGKLRTNKTGSGTAVFQPGQRRRAGIIQPLTVDPRGKLISVTDPAGNEVLQGAVNDPTTPGGTQCCLSIHDQNGDQQGCDSLLPTECAAAGGIDMGPGTCEPDPCPNTGPNDGPNDGTQDTGGTGQQ